MSTKKRCSESSVRNERRQKKIKRRRRRRTSRTDKPRNRSNRREKKQRRRERPREKRGDSISGAGFSCIIRKKTYIIYLNHCPSSAVTLCLLHQKNFFFFRVEGVAGGGERELLFFLSNGFNSFLLLCAYGPA